MLTLRIVTPEKEVYSSQVDQVSLPTPEGEITVLPNHLPVITQVKPGELIVKKGSKTEFLVTGEGFVEITSKSVSVLTDLAQASSEIDTKTAEEAKKRAEEALKQKHIMTEEEFALTAAALEKALAQLRVRRRHLSGSKSPETTS